jgi:hypothetical protein
MRGPASAGGRGDARAIRRWSHHRRLHAQPDIDPLGHFDIGEGYIHAAYVIDRATNLCYFWTSQFALSTTGILIDCCQLRKIPAAITVFQTMSESCGDCATPAVTSASAAR